MSSIENNIFDLDTQNMQVQINSIYTQIEDSINIMEKFFTNNVNYKNIINKYNKILIIGMGGSAIGAEFASKISITESKVPIFILRDYTIPNWVDKKTFVIVSSYSGNTEETLAAYSKCLSIECNSIAVSTGGKLSEIAIQNKVGLIKLPAGYQPRAAIGYSLSVMMLIFAEIGLIKKEIINDLYSTYINKIGNLDKTYYLEIANRIYGKFPVIYSNGGFMETLSIRLKGQLAENSKVLSYQSIFPEHNHNEIEGWNNLREFIRDFVVIWIKDENDIQEIKNRMNIVGGIIDKYNSNQVVLELVGSSKFERVVSMINTIDWISFYLAILYKVDPSPVNNIMKLKSLMMKNKN